MLRPGREQRTAGGISFNPVNLNHELWDHVSGTQRQPPNHIKERAIPRGWGGGKPKLRHQFGEMSC
jgi:hypothetical protein